MAANFGLFRSVMLLKPIYFISAFLAFLKADGCCLCGPVSETPAIVRDARLRDPGAGRRAGRGTRGSARSGRWATGSTLQPHVRPDRTNTSRQRPERGLFALLQESWNSFLLPSPIALAFNVSSCSFEFGCWRKGGLEGGLPTRDLLTLTARLSVLLPLPSETWKSGSFQQTDQAKICT